MIQTLLPLTLVGLMAVAGAVSFAASPEPRPFYAGADVSLLPTFERAGAVYRDDTGAKDAIAILAGRGCNLVRVRLFVDPDPDYDKTKGAVQNNAYAIALSKRIKAAGMHVLLDLHYSDTWADPAHQIKPAAWKELHGKALEDRVQDYTASTLKAFKDAGVLPEMVQVGNEIAPGMLFPDGKLEYNRSDGKPPDWAALGALVQAGIRGVRAVQDPQKPIEIVIHIHGGGQRGLPQHFFGELNKHVTDYDIMGLSFYPDIDDDFDTLKANMAAIVSEHRRDVLIAETNYPWRDPGGTPAAALKWPMTPQGQHQFLIDLVAALKGVPDGRGRGFVYWNAEAIAMPNMWVWKNGAIALFGAEGQALLAMDAMKSGTTLGERR